MNTHGADKKRDFALGIIAIILVLLIFVLLSKRAPQTFSTESTRELSSAVATEAAAPDAAAPLAGELIALPADPSALAAEKVRRAYAALATAKSYRHVMLMAGPYNENTIYHYTFSYFKTESGQDLLRRDLVVLDASTFRPIPGRGTVNLTNETGSWELHESPGIEHATFQPDRDNHDLTDLHKSFGDVAKQMPDAQYTETPAVFEGRPVTVIAQNEARFPGMGISYTVDSESGSLVGMTMENPGIVARDFYEIDAPVDRSLFESSSTDIIGPGQISQFAGQLSAGPKRK